MLIKISEKEVKNFLRNKEEIPTMTDEEFLGRLGDTLKDKYAKGEKTVAELKDMAMVREI